MSQSNKSAERGKSKNNIRYKKSIGPSVRAWKRAIPNYEKIIKNEVNVQCGWGRVVFANTFDSASDVINNLKKEKKEQRDIAFYVSDPHIVAALSPSEIFLDPSHTFRLWFENYRSSGDLVRGVNIRRAQTEEDFESVNSILASRKMVKVDSKLALKQTNSRKVVNLVAEYSNTREIVGFVTGLDHSASFNDPENGSSLWSLTVSPHCKVSGVGEALVRYLVEYFMTRGNSYLDLSVMYHNKQAISLYEKLGFERVSVYCIKRKNTINEKLFAPKKTVRSLNQYGQIIAEEAIRRGILVDVLDKSQNVFSLSLGGRTIVCRESLTDQTNAIAMSVCSDKRLTHRVLKNAGIKVPKQVDISRNPDAVSAFASDNERCVLKPAAGEQGFGVKVGLKTKTEINRMISSMKPHFPDLILEEMVSGLDIRVIVIDGKFVAASKRVPPSIVGDGKSTVGSLIRKLSRRRSQATNGESKVPLDDETLRVLKNQKLNPSSILKVDQEVIVRRTANLHTGGMILDITSEFPSYFREICEKAAEALNIPVVGLDLIIPDLKKKTYWVLEANERPGLANHEPQPTAERFIDFLFPTTVKDKAYEHY